MKIHELRQGDTFGFEGKQYVMLSPVRMGAEKAWYYNALEDKVGIVEKVIFHTHTVIEYDEVVWCRREINNKINSMDKVPVKDQAILAWHNSELAKLHKRLEQAKGEQS